MRDGIADIDQIPLSETELGFLPLDASPNSRLHQPCVRDRGEAGTYG